MREEVAGHIETIPVSKIHVLNPRVRNARVFREVIDSIATVGLKRPITVARRTRPEGTEFDLVCGQGRLEACQSLGHSTIAALVVDATSEECLVMSLVENLARRKHRSIDLLHDIQGMQQRGYSEQEIARKTGLKTDYARGVIRLLEKREHRLLRAVESGQMPVTIAVAIANADDEAVQKLLQEAYENNILRGRRLIDAKRLIEKRRRRGRADSEPPAANPERSLSVDGILRTYRESAEKKRLLVRRANLTADRLMFVSGALRKLMSDASFVALLASEKLSTLPKPLADRLQEKEHQA